MDRRGAFPARAQFLHAAAGSRSHAACDLCRLAAPWHVGRPRCWVAVRAARRPCRARAQHRLCALRSIALCRGGVCRHQGGRSRHRHRGPAQSCKARASWAGSLAHRRCCLRRHLLLRCAISSGDRRRRSVGLCACRHESRRTARASKQNLSRAHRPNVAHGKPVARHLDRAACHHGPPVWPRPCLHRHRHLLLEARHRDLRRRLFGARLHGAAGGRNVWLAERRRDARRSRPRRNHARARSSS